MIRLQAAVCLCGLLLSNAVEAVVVGAGVLPHGDLPVDPSLMNFGNGTVELQTACFEVGRVFSELDASLVFMTTPHGLANDLHFQIMRNTRLEGFAEMGMFPPYLNNNVNYKVELGIDGDRRLAEDMVDHLRQRPSGENVTGFLGNEDLYPARLRWGEVNALHFIEAPVLQTARTLLMSIPARRGASAFAMVQELLELGSEMFHYLHGLDERVIYLVSADHSHVHLEEGPYGYSPIAQIFDDDMSLFMETTDVQYLVRQGPNLGQALADGYTGLVMLGGFLNRSPWNWDAKLLMNSHPTYYGMAAATYIPLSE